MNKTIKMVTLNILMCVLFWPSAVSAFDAEDKLDQMSMDSSYTYAPKYVKDAAAREATVNAAVSQKASMENSIATQSAASKNAASDKNQPADKNNGSLDLQKKSGASGDANRALPAGGRNIRLPGSDITIGLDYDIPIGTGDIQCWAPIDADGQILTGQLYNGTRQNDNDRLIAEYFSGVKHIYVGFTDVGIIGDMVITDNPNYNSGLPEGPDNPSQIVAWSTSLLQTAIDMSDNGDVIITGEYYFSGDLVTDKNPRIYGGYNEAGHREKWTLENQSVGVSWLMGNITIHLGPDASETDYAEINNFVLMGSLILDGGRVYSANNIYYSNTAPYEYHIVSQNGSVIYYEENNLYFANMYFDVYSDMLWTGRPEDTEVHSPERDVYIPPESSGDASDEPSTDYGSPWYDYKTNDNDYRDYNEVFTEELNSFNDFNKLAQESVLDSLFENIYILKKQRMEQDLREALARVLKGSLNEFAIPEYLRKVEEAISSKDRGAILRAIIETLKDKTSDQDAMLEAAEDVLDEVKRAEQDGSTEATEAADEFTRSVTRALLAQAIPDLLREGDVSNLRTIFQDLIKAKNSLMERYYSAAQPYYEKVKMELIKNLAALQLKDIMFNAVTEKDIMGYSSEAIDRIIDRIRNSENKTVEENKLLQQENKYRKQYLDPNKKILDREMRLMLKTFSRKMSSILDLADKKSNKKQPER